MKYIRKYVRFFENETMIRKGSKTKPVKPETPSEAKLEDVVNRLERIYKDISVEEMEKIDKYFK